MEVWPETLPRRVFAESEIAPNTGLSDFDEDLNPRRTRTYPEQDTEFKILMTAAQLSIFKTFYKDALNGGSAPFSVPWLEAMGYEFHFLRFREAPSWTPTGTKWTVTMPVEIIAGVETDGEGNVTIWMPEE